MVSKLDLDNDDNVRSPLKTKRDAFVDAAHRWAPKDGDVGSYVERQVGNHFPLERELLSIEDWHLQHPKEQQASFWWIRIKLAGNVEILRRAYGGDWLELDTAKSVVRVKEYVRSRSPKEFEDAVQETVQKVVDEVLKPLNAVISEYHRKQVAEVRKDLDAKATGPVARLAAIEGTNLKIYDGDD